MVTKVLVLATCRHCNGKAYLPTEEEIFIGGLKYFRHKPCKVCEGSGTQIQWLDLKEFARQLQEISDNQRSFKGLL